MKLVTKFGGQLDFQFFGNQFDQILGRFNWIFINFDQINQFSVNKNTFLTNSDRLNQKIWPKSASLSQFNQMFDRFNQILDQF